MVDTDYCCLDALPIEILQEIGLGIEDDKDLKSYIRTCRVTHAAVQQDALSFWRRRFMDTFDDPQWDPLADRAATNKRFRSQYLMRQHFLKHPVQYAAGQGPREAPHVRMLLELAVQSFSPSKGASATTCSKNLEILKHVAKSTTLHVPYTPPRRQRVSPQSQDKIELIWILRCVLAAAVIHEPLTGTDPTKSAVVHAYNECQRLAYSHPATNPLFYGHGSKIVFGTILALLNYWKQWLQHEPIFPPTQAYEQLPAVMYPQWWDKRLSNEPSKLPQRWIGAYGFFTEADVQLQRTGQHVTSERNNFGDYHETGFQSMELDNLSDADVKAGKHYWPSIFQDHIDTQRDQIFKIKTRAQQRDFPTVTSEFHSTTTAFSGAGHDQRDTFLTSGWVHTLPSQASVPGFKRFNMMKYFLDEDTGQLDTECMWAHDGVVMPGDKIITGRWWRADNVPGLFYSGPFILWAVEGA